MERLLNDGWSFLKTAPGSDEKALAHAAFAPVALPHDWLIGQANNLYESSDGWYRRVLFVEAIDGQKRVLRFDGVYMDCTVYVNGQPAGENKYGYTAFDVDITPHLHAGDNELLVHVRHQSPNSRWYSGAGIFRDVTLYTLPACHIVPDGVYITQRRVRGGFVLAIRTEVEGGGGRLRYRLMDDRGREVAREEAGAECELRVPMPKLWSVDAPSLYTLEIRLGEQTLRQRVGFRTITFTNDNGLFLNDRPLKLKGVCLHHDLGLLGAAFNRAAARRQLAKMKAMGVNALRTSHNPPASGLMDLCDELGLLVVDECFDMWEHAKTEYDYARFFPEWHERDVRSWVRRDRNHACLLMWSIGNEIHDTHLGERGQAVTRMLMDCVRRHDPQANAPVTIGSNYMPWENARKCADIVKFAGYNYAEKYYAAHHAEHPDWFIYGSETASVVMSRAVYHFPLAQNALSDEDLQCSALGNSTTSWGARNLEHCIVDDLNMPFSLGQFIWSGIDYIGEPTPYHTRSCYFGQMDTACFPKDSWYFFRSLWNESAEPMIHIGVYWDFNPGQMIDVPVYANQPEIELFLNGESLGRQALNPRDPARCRGLWQVPCQPGALTARAYGPNGEVTATDERLSFGDAVSLHLEKEPGTLLADGEDIAFVAVSARDAQGRPVHNANNRVRVRVEGQGVLLGLDNGDSADTDEYKTDSRRLFGGLLLAMVGATQTPGDVTVTVTGEGLAPATLTFAAAPARAREGSAPHAAVCRRAPESREIPVRKITLTPDGVARLNAEARELTVYATLSPANATYDDIAWRVTNAAGIDTPNALVIPNGHTATVRALGDGDVYLRATCNNGYPHPRVLSQLEIGITGLGTPHVDPYQFVSAGLHDLSFGELGAGNDHGVSTARDGETMFGFTNLDFGPIGSDEITLPVFALDGGAYLIDIFQGDPREPGSELLGHFTYQKPPMWNVYQNITCRLPKALAGIQTLCFVLRQKAHIKGFQFTRPQKAFARLPSLMCDAVYGDSFTRTERGVENIGNNVSLVFHDMDFGNCERATLRIHGQTPLERCTVHVRMTDASGRELAQLAEFAGTQAGEQAFPMNVLPGACTVSFVFLPGTRFDFFDFQFVR